MKKKITALSLVATLFILAIGGATLAYFTAHQETTNTFTMGSVKIQLIESTLHRENCGIANNTDSDHIAWSSLAKEGPDGKAYTDEQIATNLYEDPTDPMVPGQSYHKMPYVKNIGKNAAYIRIRVMLPKIADELIIGKSQICATAISSGEFMGDTENEGWPVITTTTVDGLEYNVYTFTRVEALEPGQMTYWNVWNTITIGNAVTSENLEAAIAAGAIGEDGLVKVLVQADAIQATGFVNATDAFAAFDAQNNS